MYASPSFIGHSLWLTPREPARSRIQTIIDHHSSDKGTVNFPVHVTLIAGVEPEGGAAEVLAKAESLASQLRPISARVERTGCMDLYFKSVFAVLEKDEAIVNAHKVARKVFGQDPDDTEGYMPHASLVYGDLPMSTREAIGKEAEPDILNSEMTLDSIEVWCTQGVVAEWKKLSSFTFA